MRGASCFDHGACPSDIHAQQKTLAPQHTARGHNRMQPYSLATYSLAPYSLTPSLPWPRFWHRAQRYRAQPALRTQKRRQRRRRPRAQQRHARCGREREVGRGAGGVAPGGGGALAHLLNQRSDRARLPCVCPQRARVSVHGLHPRLCGVAVTATPALRRPTHPAPRASACTMASRDASSSDILARASTAFDLADGVPLPRSTATRLAMATPCISEPCAPASSGSASTANVSTKPRSNMI